jgi:hypothetical protein
VISAKISSSSVTRMVAYTGPISTVATAAAMTLARLLPTRMVAKSSPGFSTRLNARRAPRFLLSAIWANLTRPLPIKAVSEPEKNAERIIKDAKATAGQTQLASIYSFPP